MWFAEHFGDARHFEWLISDIVMDEIEQAMRRGEAVDLYGEFPARCTDRIETTLLSKPTSTLLSTLG